MDDQVRLLTIPEAAQRLRISRSKAYELIASGELEVVHIGRSCRVPAGAISDFVRGLRRREPAGQHMLGTIETSASDATLCRNSELRSTR